VPALSEKLETTQIIGPGNKLETGTTNEPWYDDEYPLGSEVMVTVTLLQTTEGSVTGTEELIVTVIVSPT